MCIIIDTCVFSAVFDESDSTHAKYKHVRKWIFEGKGKLVFGGTEYKRELLEERPRVRKLISQLALAEKVCRVDDAIVDKQEKRIKELVPDKKFDDKHLAAIVCACGCKLICTRDKASLKYLKDGKIYPKNREKPRFYIDEKTGAKLLTDKYIAEYCKPVLKSTNKQKEALKLITYNQ